MTDRHDSAPTSDPYYFPDGRVKSSPDDTSLLGLDAVWSELDAPLPPKRATGGRRAHGRAGRRTHRRRSQPLNTPVLIGLLGSVALAFGVIVFLTFQLV
ncbi:MAG: hypothetical protein ACODAF_07490 [Actinomycetota bacterium]